MASDHGADSHYVQQAEGGGAEGADSTPDTVARPRSCSYCRGLLDRQAAAYCAACFSVNGKCRTLCKEEPAPLAPQYCAPSTQPQPTLASGTQLQQALAALRETRDHAALNIQQTRLAFDVTRAASESGTMNVKKFKKQA